MNQAIIRPATPGDVPAIFSFCKLLSEYEKLAHEMVGTEADLHKALFGSASGQRSHAEALIAEVDDKAVGTAIYFYNFSTFLMKPGIYLEDLFVLPDYRRRGIATALLKALAREAVNQGCGRLEWSVLDWNERAITLYKDMGAVLMDEWTGCRVAGNALVKLAETA
ncbi:MAG: GNAT family N-acetyltransferase [Cyanobacteria bacterium P01_D01_bin.105]